MNLKGIPESTNYVDRSAAPWYDPNKMLANVIIGMNRLIGNKKQAEIDANQRTLDTSPTPPMTHEQIVNNYNAKVSRAPDGRGWTIKNPGQVFDSYQPDFADTKAINEVLKNSGISK